MCWTKYITLIVATPHWLRWGEAQKQPLKTTNQKLWSNVVLALQANASSSVFIVLCYKYSSSSLTTSPQKPSFQLRTLKLNLHFNSKLNLHQHASHVILLQLLHSIFIRSSFWLYWRIFFFFFFFNESSFFRETKAQTKIKGCSYCCVVFPCQPLPFTLVEYILSSED